LAPPSQTLVQFSFAQQRQKGKSGLPEASTSLNGRSKMRRPLKQ
jgi:hypothetical protein